MHGIHIWHIETKLCITSMFGRIMDILEVGIDAPKHRCDVYS